MSAPILEAIDLAKHFGGGQGLFADPTVVRAVDGVTVRIERGETFAVVGESGCGKSTLGRLLLRLIEPTAGRVTYDGRDVGAARPAELRALRRELQIVFQDPFAALNPRMTVGQIIGEPMRLHGIARRRGSREAVAEVMRTVGLDPAYASRYPHEFSGGQRQRVAIARALASKPKLVLGDEPVSALDVSIQAQIINLLERLKDELGLTLILVSHDLAVVRHMSDRVAVMYLGELVEEAPVEALYDAPLHPYTQALLASIPVRSPDARRDRAVLQGDVPSPAAPPSGCRFHTRCPHARAACRETRPPLERVEGGRRVACLFWREITAAGAGSLAPAPSPALVRRLELYRAATAAKQGETPCAA